MHRLHHSRGSQQLRHFPQLFISYYIRSERLKPMAQEYIEILGARQNNLKDVSSPGIGWELPLEIPLNEEATTK
jgi:hypothetical protein